MAEDRELVRRCLRGDSTAMRALVSQYQNDVFGLCYRVLKHQQDSEDVTQEVFLRVFRSLNKWDATRPLRPWILGIAINRCRTWLTKRTRTPEPTEFIADVPARENSTSKDGGELAQGVQEVVSAMREDYREVFILFHETGRSYEEIAEIVGRPVGTIKTWLHRARAIVLEQLQARGLVTQEEAKS